MNSGANDESTSQVDWLRVAQPQEDQYDTQVVLEHALSRGYVRRSPAGAPTCFDGTVALRTECQDLGPDCAFAPLDHPNIGKGVDLVRTCPAVYEQVCRLVDSIHVMLYAKAPYDDEGIGSRSGNAGSEFGAISTTVNSAAGFAGSVVHEMAHHKLRALGVHFETAERLILNPPEKKYRSPVRFDCLRPMCAVLQGQYAFTYSAALCVEMVRRSTDEAWKRKIAELALAVKLPKLVFGLDVLQQHAEVDAEGAGFLEGLFAWNYTLFEDGFGLLEDMGIEPKRFAHPLSLASA